MHRFDDNIKKALRDILGADNVTFSGDELLCYSYDATGKEFLPAGAAFPATALEVSEVIKLANRFNFPVIPRGAGSGFTGGSTPVRGGLVLSTERMDKILSIDSENFIATVEPGVVNGDLQHEVIAKGLFYPPDPSSLKFCTIGGNIAECAGGPRALKYGVTKDYVLGLEVVLPTGEIIETGTATMKGVVGYDLTKLMVGSEGTLGIVTKTTLKLIALPEATRSLLAVFNSLKECADSVNKILLSGALPSTLELIDGVSIKAVRTYSDTALPEAGGLLLIEVDGDSESTGREAALIEKVCRAGGAVEVRSASDKRGQRELWGARRAISPSLKNLKPDKLNEDVVVPRSNISALIEGVGVIAEELGVVIASFGHAGDGNIHVNIMIDRTDPDEEARGLKAVEEVFALTLKLGGTISGEHGVGTAKVPYIRMELTEEVIALMKNIKKLFDPNGILNPGKIFN